MRWGGVYRRRPHDYYQRYRPAAPPSKRLVVLIGIDVALTLTAAVAFVRIVVRQVDVALTLTAAVVRRINYPVSVTLTFTTALVRLIKRWIPNIDQGGFTDGSGTRQSVTLAAGENQPHSFFFVRNMLFATTRTAPAKLLRWQNPLTDLTTYDVVTFTASSGEDNLDFSCYEPATGLIYLSFRSYSPASDDVIKIRSVNPDTLSHSLFATVTQSTGLGVQRSEPIVTDGTYLYLLGFYDNGGTNEAKLYKIQLSNGSTVGTRALAGYRTEHAMVLDKPNNMLYAAGGSKTASPTATRWIAKVPTDLSSHTVLEFSTTGGVPGNVTDDMVVTDDYVYIAHEDSDGNQVRRVEKDVSSSTTFSTGVSGPAFGVWATDKNSLWAVFGVNPGKMVQFNSSGTILNTITFDSGEDQTNEFASGGQQMFVTCFLSPGKVVRLPVVGSLKFPLNVSALRTILYAPINVALTLSASVLRTVLYPIAVTLTLVASVALARILSRQIDVAMTLAASVVRVVNRPISVGITLAPAVVRVVNRLIATSLTFTVSVTVARILVRAINVALTLAPAVTRVINYPISVTLTLAPAISRVVNRVVSAGLTLTAAVSRVVNRSISSGLTLAANVVATFVPAGTIVAQYTIAATLTLAAAISLSPVGSAFRKIRNIILGRSGVY